MERVQGCTSRARLVGDHPVEIGAALAAVAAVVEPAQPLQDRLFVRAIGPLDLLYPGDVSRELILGGFVFRDRSIRPLRAGPIEFAVVCRGARWRWNAIGLTLNRGGSPHGLVNHMRQLVGKQSPPLGGTRAVPALCKDDLVATGESFGGDRSGGFGSNGAGVHTHLAKIVTEARLHEGASRRIERLTGRAQYFVDAGRRCGLSRVARA